MFSFEFATGFFLLAYAGWRVTMSFWTSLFCTKPQGLRGIPRFEDEADEESKVYFPEVQRAEWINQIIEKMWPYISVMTRDILMDTVQKTVQESSSYLSSFTFEEVDLGTQPIKLGGIQVYTDHTRKDEIIFDADLIYAGDATIKVKVKGIRAGITELQIRGRLRCELAPLLPRSPVIGGLTFYFLNCPEVDFDMTNLLNILDIPGINTLFRNCLENIISDFTVLPNRITIPLTTGDELRRIKYPKPDGVLRVEVVEARDLEAKDTKLFSKNSSDAYAVLRVGAQTFKTKVVKDSLAPKWQETFEIFVDTVHGQQVYVNVYDDDTGGDDQLGSASFAIEEVANIGHSAMWLPLKNAKRGKVYVRCSWLELSNKREDLRQTTSDSNAVLLVTVLSGKDFVENKEAKISPYIEMTIANNSKKTKILESVLDKHLLWEEMHRFLLQIPRFQTLSMSVHDKEEPNKFGKLNINVADLLNKENMECEQLFLLEESFQQSALRMRLEINALVLAKGDTSEKLEDTVDVTDDAESALLYRTFRIHVIEGKDLEAKDKKAFKKDSSDSFVEIKVGEQTFKTQEIKNSLSPKWNQKFAVSEMHLQGDKVEINVYDHDVVGKNEPMGNASFSLSEIIDEKDMWLTLKNAKSGSVHLNCSWSKPLRIDSEMENYAKAPPIAVEQSKQKGAVPQVVDQPIKLKTPVAQIQTVDNGTKPHISKVEETKPAHIQQSASIDQKSTSLEKVDNQRTLRIQVVEGRDLEAKDKRALKKNTSDPFVIIQVGDQKLKTKVIENSLAPKWNESFEIPETKVSGNMISVNVYDHDVVGKNEPMGNATFEIEDIVGGKDMWLPLNDAKSGSIHLICTWLNEDGQRNTKMDTLVGSQEQIKQEATKATKTDTFVPKPPKGSQDSKDTASSKHVGEKPTDKIVPTTVNPKTLVQPQNKTEKDSKPSVVTKTNTVAPPVLTTESQKSEATAITDISNIVQPTLSKSILPAAINNQVKSPADQSINLSQTASNVEKTEVASPDKNVAAIRNEKPQPAKIENNVSDTIKHPKAAPDLGKKAIVEESITASNLSPLNAAVPIEEVVVSQAKAKRSLRIAIIQAKDLVIKDKKAFGKGSSDPFLVVQAGETRFRTKVIEKSLAPVWNETFEITANELTTTQIDIGVFDHDMIGSNDPMGSASFNVKEAVEPVEMWLPLKNVKSGMVLLRYSWF